MDHVGWWSSKTSLHYIKLKQAVNGIGKEYLIVSFGARYFNSVFDDWLGQYNVKIGYWLGKGQTVFSHTLFTSHV